MRIVTLVSILIVVGVSSCSSDVAKKDVQQPSSQPRRTTTAASPLATVQQFLAWYRPTQDSLGSLPIVPAWLTDDGDTSDIYKVDFRVAELYLNVFRASGFVSEGYLVNERRAIQKADSTMQADRQSSGPPQGLNYDQVVFSQDPASDLEKLLRTTPTTTVRGDTARVYFSQLPEPADLREGVDLEFLLIRPQGKWVIENIRPVFID
ncbi:hypothetical protein [Hymenobacter negativus]|uniref:DUF3828 domain-containing protein n=1 Tax=Hymenobacter negativus TaxID=2795026 RepID=A0ABS3QCB4_9BACT|nr:hypothetical protein [Hymenobacter negativus]MBO2008884.1 hypothetical protein [Hymenobacter negativus]